MTKRQTQIMSAILQYQWNHDGRSPSLAEITRAVGLASESTTSAHVRTLQADGWLFKPPRYQSRRLKVLRMPGKVIRASDCEVIWRTINGKLVYVGGSDDA